MSKKLTEEELSQVQKLNQDFSENEKVLTEKYGKNAVINLQTGEVKDPPPKEEKTEKK